MLTALAELKAVVGQSRTLRTDSTMQREAARLERARVDRVRWLIGACCSGVLAVPGRSRRSTPSQPGNAARASSRAAFET